ncbi:MAG: hypothetical protein C4547_02185 [Phycisphaerales bacterium]|nr:MAG: hypothetical protein C4547_02185 [Phycisphaerales bacterium]
MRDMQILEFVFDQLPFESGNDAFTRKLKTLIKDSVMPESDRKNSKGRDVQFELYVAAVCYASDLTPVDFEEPDVTCRVNGMKFGIAAKRVKNAEKLEDRVADGANQIQRSRLPGVIALDTCLAFNPDNARIPVQIADAEFGRLYSRAISAHFSPFYAKLQDRVRGKGVCGIVIHDHQLRLHDNTWSLAGMRMWIHTPSYNQRREREAKEFAYAYGRGLPNLERLE